MVNKPNVQDNGLKIGTNNLIKIYKKFVQNKPDNKDEVIDRVEVVSLNLQNDFLIYFYVNNFINNI